MANTQPKWVQILKQTLCYLFGLLLIAFGINLAKLCELGISPVSSVPRACELIWGFSLGTTTIIVYCVLVLLQFIVLRKRFRLVNALGIVVSFLFGFLIDFLGSDPEAPIHLMASFPHPYNYFMQLLYLAGSIIIIGLGVFLYLLPKWIPMPAEGLAAAISQVSGKNFGDCKTFVDCGMILIALVLQIVYLGGFASFSGTDIVVREGTILSAVCVGQFAKLLNRLLGERMRRWIGKQE